MEQLQAVAAHERLTLPPGLATRLAEASERNLRRALLSLEACKVQHYPFEEQQQVAAPDWEMYIKVRLCGVHCGRAAEGGGGGINLAQWAMLPLPSGVCTVQLCWHGS